MAVMAVLSVPWRLGRCHDGHVSVSTAVQKTNRHIHGVSRENSMADCLEILALRFDRNWLAFGLERMVEAMRKRPRSTDRPKSEIEKRLRASGDIEAANYIASMEGTLLAANAKTEVARIALVLHTKDLLRTLKRWGMISPDR